MARKRRKKKSTKHFVLNKYKIWTFFIVLGWLYFFAFSLAQWSPILDLFEAGAFVVFWEIWTQPFFGLCILVGILFILRGDIIKTIFNQFLMLLFVLSGIFNFQVLDTPSLPYEQFWGYFSRPMLRALDSMFGGQPTAIKAFVMVLLVCLVCWILYSHNFALPSMRIRIAHEKNTSWSKSRSSSDTWTSLLSWIFSWKSSTSGKKKLLPVEPITAKNISASLGTKNNNSLLKDLFKWNVTKKVDQKMHEKTLVKID